MYVCLCVCVCVNLGECVFSIVKQVARLATNLNRLNSNLGVAMSEGCFIFDFPSLPLEVGRPIKPTPCTKVAVKHQPSNHSDILYITEISRYRHVDILLTSIIMFI